MMRFRTLSYLTGVALLFMLVAGASPVSAVDGGTDPPTGVHLTWQTADTARTITVIWQTSDENAGSVVWYDTTSHGENLSAYDNTTGTVASSPGGESYIHTVELTGLSPDTTYYFRCGGENGGHSQEWSFLTAPTSSKDFTFVAGGDSRPLYSGEQTTTLFPDARDAISREMAGRDPAFVLYTGDFVLDADNASQWDNWFGATQEYWVTEDNRMIPVIPCIGNHEIVGIGAYETSKADAPYYYALFSLPENERWYSIDWGPDLHMISLDSELPSSELSEDQRDWLENDLAAHEDYKWKIAILHRPPFSSDSHHGSYTPVREAWVDLFDQYHVDLVVNGHAHDYERTHPINYTESSSDPQPTSDDGTVYVVSGGWGAPLYDAGESWWTAYSVKKHSFLLLDLSSTNETLRLRAIDNEGSTFDGVTLPYERLVTPEFPLMAIAIFAAVLFVVAAIVYLVKGRKPAEPEAPPVEQPPAEPPSEPPAGPPSEPPAEPPAEPPSEPPSR
jgi:hypothetical protein